MKISCIILAGGKSSRLKDKALLSLNKKPLITYPLNVMKKFFSDIVVVVKDEEQRRELEKILDVEIVDDNNQVCSPIAGIKEGIKHIKNEYVFIIACDMPFIKEKTVQEMILKANDVDCVVPWDKNYEPLCAIYRRDFFDLCDLEDSLSELIDTTENKILVFIKDKDEFMNINTKEDLTRART